MKLLEIVFDYMWFIFPFLIPVIGEIEKNISRWATRKLIMRKVRRESTIKSEK